MRNNKGEFILFKKLFRKSKEEVCTTVEETVYNHLIVVHNPLEKPKIMYFFKDGLRCFDKKFIKKVINCKEYITDGDIILARKMSFDKPHEKSYMDYYNTATKENNQVWNSIAV